MTDKDLGTAAGDIFAKAFTLGYETGRTYIPAGGMALTAEQVEDVRLLAQMCPWWSAEHVEQVQARVRSMLPATEPAAVRDGSDLVVVQRSHTAKAVQSWMTLDLWTDLGKNDKDFDAEYERQGFGDLWATLLGEVRVLVQATTPAPAEPAEEETKAEQCAVRLCVLPARHSGVHTDREGLRWNNPASSPVVPAPTETGTNPVGLTDKYIVRRVDGSDAEGCRNFGRRYFVLSYDSDPHARSALAAYAASCETDYPELAADLRARLGENEPAAPTETEWQTWREVPEGRTVRAANGEMFRKTGVDAIHLLTNGVSDCCKIPAVTDLLPAPFVAAEEG